MKTVLWIVRASLLAAVVFFVLASPLRAQQVVKVGVYNFAPLISNGQEGPSGLFIEALQRVADKHGWTLSYVPGTWAECLERLKNGEIDILPSIAYSDERATYLDFTRQYLFLDWGLIYAPKGKRVDGIFDLNGRSVAALKGSIYTQQLISLLEQFDIKANLVLLGEYSEVLRAIGERSTDFGVCTNVYGQILEDRYEVERTSIVFAPTKIRYAVRKGQNQEVLRAMDAWMAEMNENNPQELRAMRDRWLGIGRGQLLPDWLKWLAGVLGGLSALLLIFVWALRAAVVRRTAELALINSSLLESESRFRSTFEQAGTGMAHVALDGRWLRVNDRLCRMLGYSREELLEGSFRDVAHPEDRHEVESLIHWLAEGAVPGWSMERRCQRKDGEDVWALLSFSPVQRADGSPDYFIVVIEDITRRKRDEERIATSLREKDLMLREIHHRVKNNLQVINGLLNLQAHASGDERLQELFQESIHRINSMALVHQNLYRSENLSAIGLAGQIEDIFAAAVRAGGFEKKLRLRLACAEMNIGIDKAVPLGLILNELFTNALKHACNGEGERMLTVDCIEREEWAVITICDDGPGLPRDFDPQAGATLGMQLVAGLSSQIRGHFSAHNAEHGGACFTVEFPLG